MKGLIRWKNTHRFYGLFWAAALLFVAIFGCIKTRNSYAFADAFVPLNSRNIQSYSIRKWYNGVEQDQETITSNPTNIVRKTFGPTTNVTSDNIQRVSLTKATTNNTFIVNNDVKFRWSILVNIAVNGDFSYGGVVCPAQDGRTIILDCKITALGINETDKTTYTDRVFSQELGGLSGSVNGIQPAQTIIKEYMYQVDIYGTFNIANQTVPYEANEINLGGNFIYWYAKNNNINSAFITILSSRFDTGYEYNEALEIAEQQRQQEQQDRNNVSQTSDDAEGDGDDASSTASGKTTSLAGAASTLISAVTSMHQTNCKIPNFSVYGMQFKNMDFCQFSLPSGLSALASVGMVFLMVPFGINVIKRMINLYNEILGGK